MFFLENLWYFMLTLCILVVFHEYGHYKVAKICGVKVLQFSVGFGPKLLHWVYKGTEFSLALLPLGGYVKMLDKTVITDKDDPEQCYDNKSVKQKIAILLAGPIFNFILAFIVYWIIALVGKNTLLPIIDSPFPQSMAERVGLQKGDQILAVDDNKIADFNKLQWRLIERIGDSGSIKLQWQNGKNGVVRNGEIAISNWLSGTVQPRVLEDLGISVNRKQESLRLATVIVGGRAETAGLKQEDIMISLDGVSLINWNHFTYMVRNNPERDFVLVYQRQNSIQQVVIRPQSQRVRGEHIGMLGVTFQQSEIVKGLWYYQNDNVVVGIWTALKNMGAGIQFTVLSLTKIITGDISFRALGGPISIAQYATESASFGLVPYLTLLALLSISLGVVNLLPIPVLDGGRIVLCCIEAVQKKPISQNVLHYIYFLGFIFIVVLMIFVVSNDILRLS